MNEKPSIIILNKNTDPNTQYYIERTDFIDFSKLGYLIIDDNGNSHKTVSRIIKAHRHISYDDINIALSKFIYDFYDMLIAQYGVSANLILSQNFYGWNLTVGDNYISVAYKDIYETKVEIFKEDEYINTDGKKYLASSTASDMSEGLIFAKWVLKLICNDDASITDEWLRKFSIKLWHHFTKTSELLYRIDGMKTER